MTVHVLITYTYFLENNFFGGAIKQANYTTFSHHSVVIEDRYKPMSEMKQIIFRLGALGDYAKNSELKQT